MTVGRMAGTTVAPSDATGKKSSGTAAGNTSGFDNMSRYGANGTSTATKTASQVTQNGWPVDGPLRTWDVPNTGKKLTLTADPDAALILIFVASQWHNRIGPITGADTGAYDKRPIGGLGGTTSNHRSGTAVDHQWATYPQGQRKMSAQHRSFCQQLATALEGTWRWGGDYGGSSLVDEQHGEILVGPGNPKLRVVADKIRNRSLGGSGAPIAKAAAAASSAPVRAATSTATAQSSAKVEEVLPPIGATTQQPIVPLLYTEPVSTDNRLAEVLVSGKAMQGSVTAAVLSATMSYSAQQIGQFQIVVQDSRDGSMLNDGVFAQGTSIDYGDQHLDVRGLSFVGSAGGPKLTVNARSRLVSFLRGPEHVGKGSWGSRDVSGWFTEQIKGAGGHPIVQPGLGTQTISRQAGAGTTEETTWAVMARVAAALGCWCYEYEQVVVVAKPSWLAARPLARVWEIGWRAHDDYSPGLDGMPAYQASYDGDSSDQLTFGLLSGDAHLARPGDKVRVVEGRLGPAAGDWIVNAVSAATTITSPVRFTCVRVKDPAVTVAPAS